MEHIEELMGKWVDIIGRNVSKGHYDEMNGVSWDRENWRALVNKTELSGSAVYRVN